MSKKKMMLALAAVSAAMFALPAAASAGEWELHNAVGQTFTITKVSSSMVLETTNGDTITCTGLSGSGSYSTTKTGRITVDTTGCTENTFGTTCQSGATNGTIQFTNKTFHNVIIGNSGDSFTPIGLLITSGENGEATGKEFVTFNCGFGLLTVKLTGNVIGEVESPVGTNGCNQPSTTFNLRFEKRGSVGSETYTQKYEQVTTTGPTFDLVADISGLEFTESLTATDQIHFPTAVTPTCN